MEYGAFSAVEQVFNNVLLYSTPFGNAWLVPYYQFTKFNRLTLAKNRYFIFLSKICLFATPLKYKVLLRRG